MFCSIVVRMIRNNQVITSCPKKDMTVTMIRNKRKRMKMSDID